MRKENNLWEKSPLSKLRIFLAIANYFIGYMMLYPSLLVRFTLFVKPNATQVPPLYEFVVYAFVMITTILLLKPLLKKAYVEFKQIDKKAVLKTIGASYLWMLAFNFLINLCILLFTKNQMSMNQIGVEQSLKATPVLIVFATLIFAPIVEEGVFRGAVFRPLRSKYSFYTAAIVSSLLFGFIHIYQSLLNGNFNDLWYLLSYSFVGFFTCRVYEKTENIYSAMLFHLLNNLLAIMVII
ncbi:MAG: type II CAAX endopeptidase family protein [Erysipelotrichaceae bacterium]